MDVRGRWPQARLSPSDGIGRERNIRALPEEHEIGASNGLPRVIKQAVRDGTLSEGVRHCWMEFADLDSVQAFVDVVRLKYQLLARPE